MKFLLAAVNAKYIHSNPGVYSLRTYAAAKTPEADIEIGEYTINHQTEQILQDIYRRKPDFIGFSCYIWNISQVCGLVQDIHKVLPEAEIWLGGPEVSYDAKELLKREPEVRGIMRGEGELTFAELVRSYMESSAEDLNEILGITYRDASGVIHENAPQRLLSLDEIPFYYEDMKDFENRIVYYESSRGCPFSCSYCLSSIDKSVRFRSMELVKRELDFFLAHRVPQVKFVDRTFNCRREHTLGIWRHIAEHDNGVTNFHFEVSADLFDEEELSLIGRMRPGLIQLEIGVQSTNPQTIREIRRTMDLGRLETAVAVVHGYRNTHQHLDLIAGLPHEGFDSFLNSFDWVYKMAPDQLQLGFLKVLKGSRMASKAAEYGLSYRGTPPYEVLSTRWLSYGEVIRLKGMEEMVEVYYNSGQFPSSLAFLEREFSSPSAMFLALADYYENHGLFGISHSRMARYEILYEFFIGFAGVEKNSGREVGAVSGKDSGREPGAVSGKDSDRRPGVVSGKNSDRGPGVVSGKNLDREFGTDDGKMTGRRTAASERVSKFRDCLMYDLYFRENLKSRPSFAMDQAPFRRQIREFFEAEEKTPRWLPAYAGCDSRQMAKMAHLEAMEDGSFVLFDYKNRDPLSRNARAVRFSYAERGDHGKERNEEGQGSEGGRNPFETGRGVWNRIPLLPES